MKKAFTIIAIMAMTVIATAAAPGKARRSSEEQEDKGVRRAKIESVVSSCRQYDGVEVVKLGGTAMTLLRGAVKIALKADNDPDSKETYQVIKGIKSMVVMEYEDCSAADREAITAKIEKALKGHTPIMEAKDDGDIMKIYGVVDDDGGRLRDFVLYSPSENTLIGMFGSISMDDVMRLAGE